jgi:hypothetical protein
MSQSEAGATSGRRDRTGGVVRDKLDLLMNGLVQEQVPKRLIDLAKDLQAALDEKFPRER